MRRKYFLKTSMEDRMRFDDVVRRLAIDTASLLTPDQAREIRDNIEDHVSTTATYYFIDTDLFDFEDPDAESYVDDRDEAEARFCDVYRKTMLDEIDLKLNENLIE